MEISTTQQRSKSRLANLPDEIQLRIYRNVYGSFDLSPFFRHERSGRDGGPPKDDMLTDEEFYTKYMVLDGKPDAEKDAIRYTCNKINKIASEAREKSFSGVLGDRMTFKTAAHISQTYTHLLTTRSTYTPLLSRVTKLKIGDEMYRYRKDFAAAINIFPRLQSVEILCGVPNREELLKRANEAGFQKSLDNGEEDDLFLGVFDASHFKATRDLRNDIGSRFKLFCNLWVAVSVKPPISLIVRVHVQPEDVRIVQRYLGAFNDWVPIDGIE